MSEENVEIVRDAAAAFNRGDLDTWFEYVADDIDYRAAEGAPDDHGPIHGEDAVRAYMQDWLRHVRRLQERARRVDRRRRRQGHRGREDQRTGQAQRGRG